eukprot:3899543-Prymnesium_polylepis.1
MLATASSLSDTTSSSATAAGDPPPGADAKRSGASAFCGGGAERSGGSTSTRGRSGAHISSAPAGETRRLNMTRCKVGARTDLGDLELRAAEA